MAQVIDAEGRVKARLLAWIKKIQKEQDAVTLDYSRRIVDFYQNKTLANVNDKIKILELKIEATPDLTPAQIKRTAEYNALLIAVSTELDEFVNYARTQLDLASKQSIRDAVIDIGLLAGIIGINQPKVVTPTAMDILQNYLRPDGELYKRINLWAGSSTDAVIRSIIDGMGLGRNPRKIAADIRKALGLSLQDALRTSRTVQMWAYREATRANFIANSDYITGWIWHAALDERTCLSCLNMHGTVHPLSEPLNDHYNGRCAMLPYPGGIGVIDVQGKDYFDGLSDAEKEERMGKARYQAYKDGKFDFSKLTRELDDVVYGLMRSETPLKELV